MYRHSNLIAGLFVLLTGGAGLAGAMAVRLEGDGARRRALDAMQGEPAPALVVEGWRNGEPMSIADLKGKVVVIDFWAVWCAPCVAAIDFHHELMEKYGDRGLVVLGVHATTGADRIDEFLKSHDVRYPFAVDVEDKSQQAYLVDTLPDLYIVGHDGALLYADVANAFHENVEAAVIEALAARDAAMADR